MEEGRQVGGRSSSDKLTDVREVCKADSRPVPDFS